MSPETRLCNLLIMLNAAHEPHWPKANVNALYDDVFDIFQNHPVEANLWFRRWARTQGGNNALGTSIPPAL